MYCRGPVYVAMVLVSESPNTLDRGGTLVPRCLSAPRTSFRKLSLPRQLQASSCPTRYHIVLSTLFATADRPWSEDTCVPGALNLLTVPTYSLRCLLVIGLITIWPKSNTLTRLRSQHCSRSTLHIVVEPLQHLFGQASYVYSV